ncbi:ATP-binding protein [Roseateles cellulosilyticus]|uniref:ATP-binding protein n=1 Tax=Pelomonas cellulosilytica TaxID=2906762 RepID=A0ABS8XS95_9BURK|nr:ATP-binding protein [Pelomonas sp. P8]MCE4555587.1 ATP-binding protein [Pelomonas sp. P8]
MRSNDHGFDPLDPEELEVDIGRRQIRERWLATYTPKALQQGAAIDNAIVKHDRFNELVGSLDRMFLLSKELRQPVGGVIGGNAGVGKTTLCRYFLDALPVHDLADRGSGVLYLRLRRGRSLAAVVQRILGLLNYPLFKVGNANLDARRSLSIDALRRRKIRLLLVDEGHQMIGQSKARRDDGTSISEYFREVMDEAQIAVCIVGGISLSELGHVDPYLESRCVVNEALSDFTLDKPWLSLVQSLMPSNSALEFKQLQTSREIREAIHKTARGNLRRLKQYLAELAMATVDARKSTPTPVELKLAYQRAFGSQELSSCPWA